MATAELTWYQKRFNESRGYRKDLQRPFKWYVNDWIKSNLFTLDIHTDGVKKPYYKEVEKKGPRGGRTGNYHSVEIPASKPTFGNYKATLFPYKWLSFHIKFEWWTAHIRSYSIAIGLGKPNWQVKFKIENNTA